MKWYVIFLIAIYICPMGNSCKAQNVEFIGSYQDTVYGLFVSGNFAYLTGNSSGFNIIDVSNPANPVHISSYDTAGHGNRIFVIDNLAYLASDSGIQIVNIENPNAPMLIGNYGTLGFAADIFVNGNYAYVAENLDWFGLEILDVSDPTDPLLTGRHESLTPAIDIFVSGVYAYLICRAIPDWGDFRILDLSNPSYPILMYGMGPNLTMMDSYVSNNYGCTASEYGGVDIFYHSSFSNIRWLGNCLTPGNATGIFAAGDYAFVADGDSGLQVIDIADPANAMIVAGYITPDSAIGVHVSGEYIYVADRSSLQILRLTPTAVEGDNNSVPGSFYLSPNYPNPFNPATTIGYDLPKSADVTLEIFDILGRKIETLVDTRQEAGRHTAIWDGKDRSSGIYFYCIQAGDYTETKQMLLLK